MEHFDVNASILRNGVLGSFVIVDINLGASSSDSFAISKSSAPPPRVKLILDVSGSMMESMNYVKTTALAAVDALANGSKLSVISFDTCAKIIIDSVILTDDNRVDVKKTISAGIINCNGGTNLEEPLTFCFIDESSNILLMTDGLANHGLLQTSKDLIGLSRSYPNYQSCIVNTMGIQQSADIVLNAELLKQLAIDTNGTFRIVPDAESLQCFVGDVLAGYYLRKYDRVNIEVMSSNGFKGKVIANPLNGFVIRSDRPTRAVFEISPSAIAPFTVTVNAMPAYSFCGLETQTFKRDSILTDDYLVSIIGCVAANAMDQGIISQAIINEVFQIANKHQKLMPLAYALKHFKHYPLHESADTVHMSQQVYNFASLGGAEADVSPAVMELRAASASLASQQNT
jgi:hypothetical protein